MNGMNLASSLISQMTGHYELCIMIEDEICPLNSFDWQLAVEAPDHHVYLYSEYGSDKITDFLGRYPLDREDCFAFFYLFDADMTVPLVGFTISSETDPPQVIFYTE